MLHTLKNSYEISVCLTCMIAHANGEDIREENSKEPEPFALFHGQISRLAMGGEHNENCTEEDRAEGCDCEDLGFSWHRCDGCGSFLGGDRFRFTVFDE